MNNVSLVKSNHSYQATQKALAPISNKLQKRLKNLNKIVVKINFVSAEIELATTPFAAVKGFIDFIKPFYQGKIIISEEATLGHTQEGFKRFGFTNLAAQNPQVEVFNSAQSKTQKVTIKYNQNQLTFPLAEIFSQSSFTASICRAKTHDDVAITLAIKNLLVGAIQQKAWAGRGRVHQGKDIHKILAALAEYTFPHLAIIDGTIGMQGEGPIYGSAIKSGWLVASLDPLAADSLASHLMGFNIEDIGYLNLMRDKGLGNLYPKDKIKITGESPENLITPFKPHPTFKNQRHWRT